MFQITLNVNYLQQVFSAPLVLGDYFGEGSGSRRSRGERERGCTRQPSTTISSRWLRKATCIMVLSRLESTTNLTMIWPRLERVYLGSVYKHPAGGRVQCIYLHMDEIGRYVGAPCGVSGVAHIIQSLNDDVQ